MIKDSPDDNVMYFDDYQVLGESIIPPVFSNVSKSPQGNFEAQVTGQPGRNYAIEITQDFQSWTPIATNTANVHGTFDFVDRTTINTSSRLYRARLLP